MTVSIHATSGWALVISLHQSMAQTTQPKRQGGRAGETDSFPSLSMSLSPPLFLPICVSHSNSPFVKAVFHHCALTQPVTFSLALLFSAPLCVSAPPERKTSGSHLPVRLSLPPCHLSACRHAHTDDQQTLPALRGPRPASFPPNRDNLPSVIFLYATQLSPLRCSSIISI